MKYGLISYDYTTNLGNEIQSIAARRFLPQIDYYIEHEKINLFKEDKNVKTIMNGWYLDCYKAWPPSNNIDPFLISMHFTTTTEERRKQAILTEESKEYLNNYGPVGCRDMATLNFLEENGINAYFSGCLTLTLDKGNVEEKDGGYIVVVCEMKEEIIQFLKSKTNKKIYFIQQDLIPSFKKAFPPEMPPWLYNLTSFYNHDEKFFMAENLLRLYENASCVITDRLHCALPCLALETPVLLLNNRGMRERFEGLNQLVKEVSFEEYKLNYNIFDVNNPPKNSNDYLKIRKDLIQKCSNFTGYLNPTYKTNIDEEKLRVKNALLLSNTNYGTREYMKQVVNKINTLNNEISSLKAQNQELINNQNKSKLSKFFKGL